MPAMTDTCRGNDAAPAGGDAPAAAPPAIETARLARDAAGTPCSSRYGDIYHSAAGAPGQARHVFLAGNGLPGRWRGRSRFVILETGFGTGLNFLATWAAWRADPERAPTLHFISFERHPFTVDDLAALHADWPEFAPLAAELRTQWPPPVAGGHRLHLDEGRVILDLWLGDARDTLPRLVASADAFYLDGFAPARNPELWNAALLGALTERAAADATLATWSVAAPVRQALAALGWQLEKAPGYAGKRDMLRGRRPGPAAPGSGCAGGHAIVLGAGLAGSCAAERLAARGWTIDLFDTGAAPGSGASGNRAGVLRPLPSLDDNRLARITRAGFLYTRRHLERLAARGLPLAWGRTGVLHLARDATHEAAQARVVASQLPPADYLRYVERDEAARRAGWPVAAGGWWFPGGAWVGPQSYCAANLAAHPERIRCHFGTRVAAIAPSPDGGWMAFDANGSLLAKAAHLVLANATDAPRLAGDWLPVRSARGQVAHLPAAAGAPPEVVVCRLGYVTPAVDGMRCAGATFLMRDDDPALRASDHAENLAKLDFILPDFTATLDESTRLTPAGRVGFRPASPDRLPMVGALPRWRAPDGDAPAPPGLWLVNGFGARGIVWSALAGELLAARIGGEALPLEAELVEALDPARFLLPGKRQRERTAAPGLSV